MIFQLFILFLQFIILSNNLTDKAKKTGEQAPGFELSNALGNKVTLDEYLKKGPVILTWYRGGWCPYCNLALQQLQEALPEIKEKGASLIALTPELPDHSLATTEKHNLKFEVLSDVGNKVAKEYGIAYQLKPEVAVKYQNSFGLHQYNGDKSNELPIPATYIIDKSGKIVYAFVDEDYTKRANPEELLKILEKIKN